MDQVNLPEYFTLDEVCCGCGCGLLPTRESFAVLYALRVIFGESIIVTSGVRCKAHNRAVGGSSDSRHCEPFLCAFDIRALHGHKEKEYWLIQCAMRAGFLGIGIKDNNFLHIDIDRSRGFGQIWTY